MKKLYIILLLITLTVNAREKLRIPNPVQNEIYVENATYIKIFTLQGRLVCEIQSNKIDVSGLATGMYFVVTNVGECTIIKN